MRTKHLWGTLMWFLFVFTFISCDKENEEGRKVTGYKEYVLTVASKKIPGVGWSDGFYYLSDMYAVKKEKAKDWETLGYIDGFEFEEGNEYQIRISETNYLDYRMGQPAWTEYDFLGMLSKEEKDSKNLPLHLIPEWYYEEQPLPVYKYAVEADNKEVIEEDLENNSILPLDHHYLLYGYNEEYLGKWCAIKDDTQVLGPWLIKGTDKTQEEFPEIYNMLPPEGQIQGFMEWLFLDEEGNATNHPSFDVFLGYSAKSGRMGSTPDLVYLYKDLTEYYKNKYPGSGVRAVVVSYAFKYGKV